MLHLFYFQLGAFYKAWNEILKKKHTQTSESLLRTQDLMLFQISMKATGNIFKAGSV